MDTISPASPHRLDISAESHVVVRDLHLTLHSAAGPVNILRGIDLDIAGGQSIGLVGPSGSGKTSLLMVLAGLEHATSGSVRVGEAELTRLDEDQLARLRRDRIGIVFQSFHLIPSMSALENVAVPLELAGNRDAMAVAAETLRAVGLGHRLTHFPGQLSGGEQQRVAVARALINNPALIFADEPSGNLDSVNALELHELFIKLREDFNQTFVIVTHNEDLANLSDRTVTMKDGLIVQ